MPWALRLQDERLESVSPRVCNQPRSRRFVRARMQSLLRFLPESYSIGLLGSLHGRAEKGDSA